MCTTNGDDTTFQPTLSSSFTWHIKESMLFFTHSSYTGCSLAKLWLAILPKKSIRSLTSYWQICGAVEANSPRPASQSINPITCFKRYPLCIYWNDRMAFTNTFCYGLTLIRLIRLLNMNFKYVIYTSMHQHWTDFNSRIESYRIVSWSKLALLAAMI